MFKVFQKLLIKIKIIGNFMKINYVDIFVKYFIFNYLKILNYPKVKTLLTIMHQTLVISLCKNIFLP